MVEKGDVEFKNQAAQKLVAIKWKRNKSKPEKAVSGNRENTKV